MKLNIFDFPLTKEKNKIYSKSGELIINLRDSSAKEKDEFFKLILSMANYGKRYLIKRITRSYPVSLKECEDIAIMDAHRMGYKICKQEESTMEYIVISTLNIVNKKSKKLYFKENN